jgi:D-alanyl-D-alanine endopeptidase (penicillin-binding protein 7)
MTPKTRRELYAWNENELWPTASLTKLVSALAWKDKALPMKKVVTLLKKDEVGGGRLRVPVGTKVYFEDLWYSSITASANNAAVALARLSGFTTKQLLAKMNKEAELAGAKSANFVDASGMDEHNVATAKEMALIADRAFSVRAIQKAASMTKHVVSVIGKRITPHPIWTTNTLLRYDPDVWVIAGKTGYLNESRHNLVVWMRPVGVDGKPEMGKDVLIVVYGAPDTDKLFASAKALAQSIWKSDAFTSTSTTAAGKK